MIARLTKVEVPPDKFDEVIQSVGGLPGGLAVVREASGSKGVLLMADRTSGKIVMVTLWETAAAMEASNTVRDTLLARVAALGATMTSTEVVEVLAQL